MPKKERDFIELWHDADLVDAAIGGMDSVPERERKDYGIACRWALLDDFAYGRQMKAASHNPNLTAT